MELYSLTSMDLFELGQLSTKVGGVTKLLITGARHNTVALSPSVRDFLDDLHGTVGVYFLAIAPGVDFTSPIPKGFA